MGGLVSIYRFRVPKFRYPMGTKICSCLHHFHSYNHLNIGESRNHFHEVRHRHSIYISHSHILGEALTHTSSGNILAGFCRCSKLSFDTFFDTLCKTQLRRINTETFSFMQDILFCAARITAHFMNLFHYIIGLCTGIVYEHISVKETDNWLIDKF